MIIIVKKIQNQLDLIHFYPEISLDNLYGEIMSNIKNLNAETFENEISGNVPVLVDFWAEWCAPCKALAPILDDVSDELAGKIVVTKVNLDENQDLAMKYSIRSIPTLLLFKNGELLDMQVGLPSKSDLVDWISSKI
jgi:thioredoxin 1